MNTDNDPRNSRLYKEWLAQIAGAYTIISTHIQSVDYVKKNGVEEALFIKLKAELQDSSGRRLTRVFFLRGSTVAILLILTCEGVEYVVLVRQPRPAIGGLNYPELPAGIVEAEGVQSAALRELEEETGITVLPHELIDMCNLFYGGAWKGIYPSPGACDEIVHLFLCRKDVDQVLIESMQGKATGLQSEDEQLEIEIVKLDKLCVSTPDPKAHSAFVMYQALTKKEHCYECVYKKDS